MMNFEEAGSVLRAEREKRHLSLEDVATQLKISARQLRAIEAGDIDSLPHPVYAKGFIRSYATWLGINVEDARKAMASEHEDESDSSEPELQMDTQPRRSSGALLAFLAICAIAGGAYYVWQSGMLDFLLEKQPAAVSVHETLPTADSYIAAKEAARAEKAQNVPERPVESPSAAVQPGTVSPREEPAPKVENTAPAEQIAPLDSPAKKETATQSGHHKLVITAIEECWVHSNADKTDTRQFSLRKGDTFALTFVDSLELKLGNAGGVRLRYDGQDLDAPGTSGQVKTISFPPAD